MLLTHHHCDHVSEVGPLRKRWPELEVLIHPLERELVPDGIAHGTIEAGAPLHFGALDVRPLHTPGHTAGMLSFLVGELSRRRGGRARGDDTRRAGSRAAGPPCSPVTRCSRARSAACARRGTPATPTCATRSWAR